MRALAEIVPLRTPACREAEGAIVTIAAGEPEVDHAAARHIGTCLRCQAEVAAYRRVMAVMRAMRDYHFPGPDAAVGEVSRPVRPVRPVRSVRSDQVRPVRSDQVRPVRPDQVRPVRPERAGRVSGDHAPGVAAGDGAMVGGGLPDGAALWAVRAAYVGGLTAAGAAGLLMWISRRRLGLPEAS